MVVDPQFLAARGIGKQSAKPVVATFSVRASFTDGWQAVKARYGLVLGTVVVIGALIFAAAMAAGVLDVAMFPDASTTGPNGGDDFVFTPVSWLAHIFITWPLITGATLMGARLVRGDDVEVATPFTAFGRIFHIAAITVVMQLAAWLMMLGVSTATDTLRQSGSPVLGIIAGLVGSGLHVFVISRISMTAVVCLDGRVGRPGVIESLALNWRMTAQWRWLRLIVIYILLSIITAICAIAFILPAIFVAAPLALGVWGAAYAQIVASHERRFGPGRCTHCGYDLHGLPPGPCPECGGIATA